MDRNKYILEQSQDRTELINVDFNESELKEIRQAAMIMDVSVEDFVYIAINNKMIELETEKYSNNYENIIDIYELGLNIEHYIETGKIYFVINPNGNHVILMPSSDYEDIKKLLP